MTGSLALAVPLLLCPSSNVCAYFKHTVEVGESSSSSEGNFSFLGEALFDVSSNSSGHFFSYCVLGFPCRSFSRSFHPSEDYSYPHLPSHAQYDCFSSATTSGCYCASCEAEHLDTIRASEYFSYPSTDYVNFAPSAAATSDFYMRETNCDICYSS